MVRRTLALCAATTCMFAFGAGETQAQGWGGYYIGFNAGQSSSDVSTDRTITSNTYFIAANMAAVEAASMFDLEQDAFSGGIQMGMNWPVGQHFVIGAEIDGMGLGIDATDAATVTYPASGPSTFTVSSEIEQTWAATARLRAGFANDFALLYVTGGFAGGDVKFLQTFSDTFTPFATQTVESEEFLTGYSVGGGVEFMLESGFSLRVEYLYLDLGEATADGPIASGTTTSNGTADVTDQIVRAALNVQID